MWHHAGALTCIVSTLRGITCRCSRQSHNKSVPGSLQCLGASFHRRLCSRKPSLLTLNVVYMAETHAPAAPIPSSNRLRYSVVCRHPSRLSVQWCFGLPGRSFNSWWEYFTRVVFVGILVGGRCESSHAVELTRYVLSTSLSLMPVMLVYCACCGWNHTNGGTGDTAFACRMFRSCLSP